VAKLILLDIVILLISLASYRYVEAPARVWLRSLWRAPDGRPRRLLAATVAASPVVVAAILVIATPAVLSVLQAGLGVFASGYHKICASSRDTAFRQVSRTCDALAVAYEAQRYKLRRSGS
jgi:hypothetical protein